MGMAQFRCLWIFIFGCGRHGKCFYMCIVVAEFSRSLVHGAYRTQNDFVGSHDSASLLTRIMFPIMDM